VDGNGTGDLSSSFVDDLSAGLVCYEEYEMTGNEINNNLIHVPLNDLITSEPFVTLDANDAYYISLLYDGVNAGTGNCVRFSSTGDVAFASFTGYPTTPLYLGSLFGGGWAGATVVQRLELEGFNPTNSVAQPKRLDASKFNITPNPANEFVNVELNLENLSPSVAISVVDNKGRMVSGTKVEKNFQNGVVNLNTANIPSGTYYLWIRTAEGSTLKPVAICH